MRAIVGVLGLFMMGGQPVVGDSTEAEKEQMICYDESRKTAGPELPREAFDACAGKSSGDSCSFKTGQDLITGICREVSEDAACVPEK